MKYKLLTILIFSLTVFNVSAVEEKKKNNYFGDDKYHSGELKKETKRVRKSKSSGSLETNEKKGKKPRRKLKSMGMEH